MPILAFVSRFRCDRGAAVVEFGLVAPLLLVLLGLGVEFGRLYNAYRELGNAVYGISRELAQFPEYDKRARDYAPPIAAALLPSDWRGRLSMQITSLTRDQGQVRQAFTHTLFGTDPGLPWSNEIGLADYVQSEYVIHVAARYDFAPIFGFMPSSTISLTKTHFIAPFFSRKYIWNDNVSEDKYVN